MDCFWTQHALYKLRQYGLSQQRVKRVIRAPFRVEEGIVPKTIAVMQPVSEKRVDGKKAWKQEIWAMYKLQAKGRKSGGENEGKRMSPGGLKIISAWRYPGVSPKNDPIPEEILRELKHLL